MGSGNYVLEQVNILDGKGHFLMLSNPLKNIVIVSYSKVAECLLMWSISLESSW